jgi:hypothetical protein
MCFLIHIRREVGGQFQANASQLFSNGAGIKCVAVHQDIDLAIKNVTAMARGSTSENVVITGHCYYPTEVKHE